MSAAEHITISTPSPGVALVEIDNPPANALTEELYAELGDTLTALDSDEATRAVIFASAHASIFISGADISAMANYDFRRGAVARKIDLVNACFLRVQRFSKPTIGAIEGHALGGGCEFALALDFRFMVRGKARIGLSEAALGLIPGGGGTQRLPRLIGRARATELMMLAERLDADRAEAIGLINGACDPGEVRPRAIAHAERLAAMPRGALRLIKRALNDGFDGDIARDLAIEREAAIEAVLSADAREGISAFLEKRPAVFE